MSNFIPVEIDQELIGFIHQLYKDSFMAYTIHKGPENVNISSVSFKEYSTQEEAENWIHQLYDLKNTSKTAAKSDLIVMQEMAERSMDICAFPNVKRAQTGKNGWGELICAVPNPMILNMNSYLICLYMVNAKQFKQLKGSVK